MIVGRETDRVELDNTVDFAEKGSDFLVLATEHVRVAGFYRGAEQRGG